jgi:protoheme IX farnesyltransferase
MTSSVFVGAFGAIQHLLGWVAATGEFGMKQELYFLIQFFPHFGPLDGFV